MNQNDLLLLTQSNLDLLSVDENKKKQLEFLINSATELIAREGVMLSEPYAIEDANLIVMYASYLFRKRATNEPMPRMLRWALNNRIFGGKADET